MRKLKKCLGCQKSVDSTSSNGRTRTMEQHLDDLFERRGSTRESALSSIIEGFTINYQHEFAEKNFATILYRCLKSFEKGTSKEIGLASHVLGLLAITIGCGEKARELYREAIHPLSQALKSSPESILPSILGCLAIVTFIGRSNVVETEKSMQIIWRFIHSKSSFSGVVRKYSNAVLAAAISAWSFLLTSIDGWNLDYNHWQGAISFFLDILEANDGSVHAAVAAGESLALIFEVGSFEKFVCDNKGRSDCANYKKSNGYSSIQELKEKIIGRIRGLSLQTEEESCTTKAMNKKCNSSWEILILEGCFLETSVKIDDQVLKVGTWSQLLQVSFVKNFLGVGFVKHMLVNKLLRDIFDFTRKQLSGNDPYICERIEVIVRCYIPVIRFKANKANKASKVSSRKLAKAVTTLLHKQRDVKDNERRLYDD